MSILRFGASAFGGGGFRLFSLVGWGPAKRYMKTTMSEVDVEWPPSSRLTWRWRPNSPKHRSTRRDQNCRCVLSCGFKHLRSTCTNMTRLLYEMRRTSIGLFNLLIKQYSNQRERAVQPPWEAAAKVQQSGPGTNLGLGRLGSCLGR